MGSNSSRLYPVMGYVCHSRVQDIDIQLNSTQKYFSSYQHELEAHKRVNLNPRWQLGGQNINLLQLFFTISNFFKKTFQLLNYKDGMCFYMSPITSSGKSI